MSEVTSQSQSAPVKKKRRTKKKKAANGSGAVSADGVAAKKRAAAAEAEKAARAAVKEAEKAAAQAAREAAAAAKKAEKEAEKAKAEAEREKVRQSALKSLDKCAKEINGRFANVERGQARIDDQRLSAAIVIAEAKEIAREAGIAFKPWCEEHLFFPPKEEGGERRKLSYESVRKLLPVGEAERDEEGKGLKMLEDMREANAEANRQARQRARENAPPKESKTPEKLKARAQKALDELEGDEFTEVLEQQAHVAGYKLVEEDSTEVETAAMKPIDRAKHVFGKLRGKTKLAAAAWVCEQVGWQSGVPVEDEEPEEDEVEEEAETESED